MVGEEGGVGGCRGERGNAVVSDEVEGVELESVEAWAKAVSDSPERWGCLTWSGASVEVG